MKMLEAGWICSHDDFQTIQLHNRKQEDQYLYSDLCFPENYTGRKDDGSSFTFHLSDHDMLDELQKHIEAIAPSFADIKPNISFQSNDAVMDNFYWRFRARPPASVSYNAAYIRNFRDLHGRIKDFIAEWEANYANSPLFDIFGATLMPKLRRRKEFDVEVFVKGMYCSTKFSGGYIEHDREILKVHEALVNHYNLTPKQVKIWRCWNYPTNRSNSSNKTKSNRCILKVDLRMTPLQFISEFYAAGYHLLHGGLAPITLEPLSHSPASAFDKRFKRVAELCDRAGLIRRFNDDNDKGGSGRSGRNNSIGRASMHSNISRSVPNSADDQKQNGDNGGKGQGNNSDDAHSAALRKAVLYKEYKFFRPYFLLHQIIARTPSRCPL